MIAVISYGDLLEGTTYRSQNSFSTLITFSTLTENAGNPGGTSYTESASEASTTGMVLRDSTKTEITGSSSSSSSSSFSFSRSTQSFTFTYKESFFGPELTSTQPSSGTSGTGSNSQSSSGLVSFSSTLTNTYTAAVYNTAYVTSLESESEVYVEDEDGGYFETQTYAETKTTRVSSTSTTTQSSVFTTSKDSDDKISFNGQSTTLNVTTSTTATATFESFWATTASTVLTVGQDSTYLFYAAPDEVLWSLPEVGGFSSAAILTQIGNTVTSLSEKLNFQSVIPITTSSAGGTLSFPSAVVSGFETGSYIRTTTQGTSSRTVFPNGQGVLPVVTSSFAINRITTTSSSYLKYNYNVQRVGGVGAFATAARNEPFVYFSQYPVKIAFLGLEYETLATRYVSTQIAYSVALEGYSNVGSETSVTVAGNSLVNFFPTQTTWGFGQNVLGTGGYDLTLSNIFANTRRSEGIMTSSADPQGWLTGVSVPTSETSRRTTVQMAQHYSGRHVPLPGSFEKYTVSKNSFTYTLSTSAESTASVSTTSTTSSTLLALAGSARTSEGSFAFGAVSARIGGGAQIDETIFANVVGVAKVNNSAVSTFGANLSSTTGTNGTASFVHALPTIYAVPVTPQKGAGVLTQRNITTLV
jgi:trimeric autotransporter adhesin